MVKKPAPHSFQRTLVWALGLLLVASSSAALAEIKLLGSNAWIRLAPPGSMMLAGYVELENKGEQPLRITGGQSGLFGSVEIHRTEEVDGVSRMRAVPVLELAPGQRVVLEPGGMHLMLMQPHRELSEGSTVAIDLLDEGGASLPVAFTVRREAPGR